MNVGLATDFSLPWIGGPSILIDNLCRGLTARGHRVALLAPSPDGPASQQANGPVRLTRASTVPSPVGHGLRVSVRARRDAERWLETERPDVVHVHHPFPISAAVVFAARKRNIPVVATNHTVPECSLFGIRKTGPLYAVAAHGFGTWIGALLSRCTAVATPTATAARALPALGYCGPVTVISNGVDTLRFVPAPGNDTLRRALGFDTRPIVLYTGRLDAEKEMDVWLRAAALLARQWDVQFAVGGNGSERARLEVMARSLGIADRTRFYGYVEVGDLPAVYALASAYFITSPVELQSISTLEAVSSGLPVVAADAMALPELVRDGVNGFLFPPGDAEGAASGLSRVLANGDAARRMSVESRRIAEAHDLQRTFDAYELLLQGAVSNQQVVVGERAVSAG